MAGLSPDDVVHAAGGVVWRRRPAGGIEILLVHRPRYDDWTLPKGKLLAGEGAAQGARREVAEETGLVCALGPELASASYRDAGGRPKVVRYWAMTPLSGEFAVNHEVDEVRWTALADAPALLSYDHDRAVVATLEG